MVNNRDYGDESDCGICCAEVNQTPAGLGEVQMSMSIETDSRLSALLAEGLEVGDFVQADDGAIVPVVPSKGGLNRTWTRLLLAELVAATGNDPEEFDFASEWSLSQFLWEAGL